MSSPYCDFIPTHYESYVRFNYWDRVQVIWNPCGSNYTVDNIYNNWRFYSGCTGTIIGISYNYTHPDKNHDDIVEIIYSVAIDDCIGWDEYVYFHKDNLELIGDENEYWSIKEDNANSDEDESLEDFIDTAIDVLEDWKFSSDTKSWANKLIRALKCAKEYLIDNYPIE